MKEVSLLSELEDRSFRPADRPALLEIERSAGEASWSNAQMIEFLRRPSMVFRVVVHRSDTDAPIGFYVVQQGTDTLYLANIVVAPAWRRRGVAGCALLGVESIARERGCRRVLLDVQERNLGAQLLYRAHGFRAFQIRRGGYGDQDGYRMEKQVNAC